MTPSSTSPHPEPLPADARAILDHIATVAHGFLYVGDIGMEEMHATVDSAFNTFRSDGIPSEQALAHIKTIVRRVHTGGSLGLLDEEAAHWLTSHLVTWLIASYYG